MDRSDLKIYQQTAIDFLLYNPFSALWLDMGLGKTVSVLTMLADLLELGLIERVLIVAPIKVAVRTWPNEIAKWDHLKHLEFQVIRPTGDEPEIVETAERARRAAEILRVPRASVAGLVARAETQARERVRRALARRAVPLLKNLGRFARPLGKSVCWLTFSIIATPPKNCGTLPALNSYTRSAWLSNARFFRPILNLRESFSPFSA